MASKHILVIDDDPDVREALKLILEPKGFELTVCATGPAGREAAARRVPDLIMLDIMLSTVSEGFHMAYEFRKDEALANVPIIIISSIGDTVGIDFSKELGTDYMPAESFLTKPLQAATVLRAVEHVLAGVPSARQPG
jgi:DNA-binding response OmpR family regulator